MNNQNLMKRIRNHKGIVAVTVPGYYQNGKKMIHYIQVRKAVIIDQLSLFCRTDEVDSFDYTFIDEGGTLLLGRKEFFE